MQAAILNLVHRKECSLIGENNQVRSCQELHQLSNSDKKKTISAEAWYILPTPRLVWVSSSFIVKDHASADIVFFETDFDSLDGP